LAIPTIELPAKSQELRIGANQLTVTGDLVFVHENKRWTEEEISQYLDLLAKIRDREGRVYAISMNDRLTELTSGARRIAAQWFRTHTVDLAVQVGASTPTRGMLALVFSALRLLSGRELPFRFCGTLAEARALVATVREKQGRGS
jgi:hypothetical protein